MTAGVLGGGDGEGGGDGQDVKVVRVSEGAESSVVGVA